MSRPEPIEVPVPGEPERSILGRLLLPERGALGQPAPVVILAHGYKSPLEWGWFPDLQQRLACAGMASVAFLHSCSGLTRDGERITDEVAFARNTYTRELRDLGLVRDWLGQRPDEFDTACAGLYGFSRGGGMGLLHAAERGAYAALVLWAPMDAVLKFAPETLELWRARGWTLATEYSTGRKLRLGPELLEDADYNRQRLNIPAAARRLRAPVLLVGAERDVVAPPQRMRRLALAFPAGVVHHHEAPGVGHTFGLDRTSRADGRPLEEALALTVGHFAAHLCAPRE